MKDFTKEEKFEQSIRLRKSRKIRGMSIEEFAGRIGMSSSGYQKVESGYSAISRRLLRNIWLEYSISADFILYGEKQNIKELVSQIECCNDSDKLYIFWNLAKYIALTMENEKFNRGISSREIEEKLKELTLRRDA